MLRCHFIFFVIGLLFLIAACICGLVGCWNVRVRLYLAAGICIMTAGRCMHGLLRLKTYLEMCGKVVKPETQTRLYSFAYVQNLPQFEKKSIFLNIIRV